MRKKLLPCAVLCVAVLAVTVWLAGRDDPNVRVGMGLDEVRLRIHAETLLDPPDKPGNDRICHFSTDPDWLGRRRLYRIRFAREEAKPGEDHQPWLVQSWESKPLSNDYVPWLSF
jgi:hypothetical protein